MKCRKRGKSKFNLKSREHVFLGYDSHSIDYLLQGKQSRKLTRASSVLFEESKIISFQIKTRDIEHDFLIDVSFDEGTFELGHQNFVKTEIRRESLSEPLAKFKNLESEKSYSSVETENQEVAETKARQNSQAKTKVVTVQLLGLSLGYLSQDLANLELQEVQQHSNVCLVQAFASQK